MFNPFIYMLDWLKDYFHYHRAMQELSRLDDRELQDLGLNRYDIPYVAFKVWGAAKP